MLRMVDLLKSLDFLFQFDEPTSRLYHVNILSTLILIGFAAVVAWQKTPQVSYRNLLKKWILNKKYWWNSSSRQDYQIYILNGFLKTLILVPLFECSFLISKTLLQQLIQLSQYQEPLNISTNFALVFLFTLFAFIWDDFLRFFHHLLMHKVPWLWEFHKTHHSARVLTPLTLYRNHPLESVIAIIRNSLSLGVSSALFVFLFGSTLSLWTLMGVNGFGFIFNLVGANLRHSHIPLSFGFLEKWIISPLQHQIHHSVQKQHYDKNFGVTLAVWDRIYGSLIISDGLQNLRFGLNEKFDRSTSRLLLQPLKTIFNSNLKTTVLARARPKRS